MSLTTWRKSSFSDSAQTNCVEVAYAPTGVAVRDSKNTKERVLTFDANSWRALTAVLSR